MDAFVAMMVAHELMAQFEESGLAGALALLLLLLILVGTLLGSWWRRRRQ